MLVAAFLAAICTVAGAPVFPGDRGKVLGRAIDGLSPVLESYAFRDSTAVLQPGYGQYGFDSPAYADRSEYSVAHATPHHYTDTHTYSTWNGAADQRPEYDQDRFSPRANTHLSAHFQDAHTTPHNYADEQVWLHNPQNSESSQPGAISGGSAIESPPRLASPDLAEVIALIHEPEHDVHDFSHRVSPNSLHLTSTEIGQQQHLGSPAEVIPGAFEGIFADHLGGAHQSTGARGSLSSIPSSSLHHPAGLSSVLDETFAGQAWDQANRPTLSREESRRRRKERNRIRYRRNEAKKDQWTAWPWTYGPVIAQGDMDPQAIHERLVVDDQELLALATPLFTVGRMGPQTEIEIQNTRGNLVPLKGCVKATLRQMFVIERILMRRLEMFKKPGDPAFRLRLEPESASIVSHRSGISALFRTVQGITGRILDPFEEPPLEGRAGRRYLHEFGLGDYMIYVHAVNNSSLLRVVAYPRATLGNVGSKWNPGDPVTVFLGYLQIQEALPPVRLRGVHADFR